MSFTFAKFIIKLKLEEDVTDRFAFFRMRSDFESAFRASVCTGEESCRRCASSDCLYTDLFAQTPSSEPDAVRRHQKPPLPFAFQLPVLTQPTNNDTIVTIGLALAGKAVNAAPQFFAALQRMEKPASAIISLHSVGASGKRTELPYESAQSGLVGFDVLSLEDLVATSTLSMDKVKLTLTTPLRLVEEGRLVISFDHARFLRHLIRRISSLAQHYCDTKLLYDFSWLSTLAGQVTCRGPYHYSDWQDPTKKRFTGVLGNGYLEGGLGDLIPFLLLGEHFNVGKGCSFGLGRYKIEPAD